MQHFQTNEGHDLTSFARLEYAENNLIIDAFCAISLSEQTRIKQFFSEKNVQFNFNVVARAVQSKVKRHKNIKNVIAVGAGKGGVGKTSIAINLAKALSNTGVKVGLLDLDIYGPNVPRAMGDLGPKQSDKQHDLVPVEYQGIQTISLAQVVAADDPILWRGPMTAKVAEQMFTGAEWAELDYLILDLPPGTGDVHISVCQKLPITAAVLVSTPQTISYMDTLKAYKMFDNLQIPVLGYVSNMAYFDCGNCDTRHNIFPGSGKMPENIACLLELPLAESIAKANEFNTELSPKVLADFDDFAFKVSYAINEKAKDRSSLMPEVMVVKKESK